MKIAGFQFFRRKKMQTPKQTSLFQKILKYVNLASTIAGDIPDAHVDAIAVLIETLSADLIQSAPVPTAPSPTLVVTPVPMSSSAPNPLIEAPLPAQVTLPPVQTSAMPPADSGTTPPAWFEAWLASQKKGQSG